MAAVEANYIGPTTFGYFSPTPPNAPGNYFGVTPLTFTSPEARHETVDFSGTLGGSTTYTYYQMRARDLNAGGVLYRYWTVTGEPDNDASSYTGPYSGVSRNFGDISVVYTFEQ
jgi:hypothetical protein